MTEEETFLFIRDRLKSVWALELLMLFHRLAERDWTRDELVRELRGSQRVVQDALESLKAAAVVSETAQQRYRFTPATEELRSMVSAVADLYATRPIAVIKAISASPNEKLQIFSDAFKIRDK